MPKIAAAKNLPAKYEDALGELETLVARLEGGQLPLDELLGAYQRGAALLAACRNQLTAVENQIQVMEADGLKSLGEGA